MNANYEDYEAIAAVLNMYVEGGRTGNAKRMTEAFHPSATIHGHTKGALLSGPIQALFDFVSSNPPAKGLRAQVCNITVSGTVASARMELSNWNGVRFTDLFALLKTDGAWRIITKVYDAHADA
ncbi:MAG: nuclear transport factor 2 family protein [Gemmataceae bacterium]|nr:nuclear transport factor 2 family protein [Gemmataceae bacterium]